MKKFLSIAILLSGISLGFAKDVKLETEKTPNVQTINTTNSLVKNEEIVNKKVSIIGTWIHVEFYYVIGDALYYNDYWICVP